MCLLYVDQWLQQHEDVISFVIPFIKLNVRTETKLDTLGSLFMIGFYHFNDLCQMKSNPDKPIMHAKP